MGAVVVLDSGALVALWDPDDVHHQAAVSVVRGLRDSGSRFVVPSIVLAEVLVGAARQGEARLRVRRDQFRAAFGVASPVDARAALEAARLRASHPGIRLGDAVVIAFARTGGAAEILTHDSRWPDIEPRVRVIG
jgi:predicted nucleic acid-binding protein